MVSTRIYHNVTRLPITSTLLLVAANFELYRIHKGTHPYFSPVVGGPAAEMRGNKAASDAPGSNVSAGTDTKGEGSRSSIQWLNLNGVPVPFLALGSTE